MGSLLVVEELVKTFLLKKGHTFTALKGINFSLHEGEILGVLGPNGAGKTTIIQILLSVLTPTAGRIFYFGKDFFQHRNSRLLKTSPFMPNYMGFPLMNEKIISTPIFLFLVLNISRTKKPGYSPQEK